MRTAGNDRAAVVPAVTENDANKLGKFLSQYGRESGRWRLNFQPFPMARNNVLARFGIPSLTVNRVLFETMDDEALPKRLFGHKHTLTDLVNVYKQRNAPLDSLPSIA